MRPGNKQGYFACGIVGFLILVAGCATAPQTFSISSVPEASAPPSYGTKDYVRTLAAIASLMSQDFRLPVVDVSVTIYPSQVSYESGVVAQVMLERERLKQQLGLNAKLIPESEDINAGRRLAVSTDAVGNYRNIVVNNSRASRYLWHEWVRLLAHELTHSAERELTNGRPSGADQWLREGFADWVGYQVADRFGAENFANSRQRVLDGLATARFNQTFPGLNQLARNSDWVTWFRTLGHEGTYGQALIAVDVLIEEKGIAAVVQYFRLFGKLNNREKNFSTAFGESLTSFDGRFAGRLEALIGK